MGEPRGRSDKQRPSKMVWWNNGGLAQSRLKMCHKLGWNVSRQHKQWASHRWQNQTCTRLICVLCGIIGHWPYFTDKECWDIAVSPQNQESRYFLSTTQSLGIIKNVLLSICRVLSLHCWEMAAFPSSYTWKHYIVATCGPRRSERHPLSGEVPDTAFIAHNSQPKT